jgi:spore coat polysaccharide biosynthesis protein SpsF
MTGLFLQCRLDSTRLPQKALLPLGGKPLIVRVMEALNSVNVPVKVLLTTDDSKEALLPHTKSSGFELFTGSKEDVLERYVSAARYFEVDQIVRATGDNPYVSSLLANEILTSHLKAEAHYSGFLGMPLGTGVEVLNRGALETALKESQEKFDHEHVAPYLYNNPQRFIINRPDISKKYGYGHIKISVDTQEDLDLAQKIYRDCREVFPVEIDRLMEWIKAHYA